MPHICFLFTGSLHRPLHLPPLESNCCERVGLSSSPTWRSRDSPHTSSRPWEGNWNLLPFSTGAFFTPRLLFSWLRLVCWLLLLFFGLQVPKWKLKEACLDSEPVQWFWVTLFNLLASASITAASSGLSAPGGHSCFALPVRPAYHEHQHQQQEGQVLHSTRLTRYRTEEGGWRLFLFLSEQAVEVHEVRTVWMMSAAAVFSSLSTTNYERY